MILSRKNYLRTHHTMRQYTKWNTDEIAHYSLSLMLEVDVLNWIKKNQHDWFFK